MTEDEWRAVIRGANKLPRLSDERVHEIMRELGQRVEAEHQERRTLYAAFGLGEPPR